MCPSAPLRNRRGCFWNENLTESTDLSALNINPPTGIKSIDTPEEYALCGSGRLGLARVEPGKLSYIYELADHLGNVRASIKKEDDGSLGLISQADYYPFGMLMPGRTTGANEYRFGYQGQFAEKDEETGYNQFEARLYDSRLGRWLTTDPAGQFYSPYLGMGNIPTVAVDPDGRDVVVIVDSKAVGTLGHAAVIIGSKDKGWSYYSVNGTGKGKLMGSSMYSDVGVSLGVGISVTDAINRANSISTDVHEHNYDRYRVMKTNSLEDKHVMLAASSQAGKDYYNVFG